MSFVDGLEELNRTDAENRLARFVSAVENGDLPPPEDLALFADAFRSYLDADDKPAKDRQRDLISDLGLKGSRGRKKSRLTFERRFGSAYRIAELRADGTGLEDAKTAVAEEMGISPDTLDDHWTRYGNLAKGMVRLFQPVRQKTR